MLEQSIDKVTGWLRGGAGKLAKWLTDLAADLSTETAAGPSLAPLTPAFNVDQHQIYVDHLNAAIADPKIRNIALTGRYGSGKSSVLEAFAQQRGVRDRALFLALSTLAPDQQGESRTNQIEKELVKQLLHRERPSRLPQSRYQRIKGLRLPRAAAEVAALCGALGVGLWLFGVFPGVAQLTRSQSGWLQAGAAVVAAAAVVTILTWVRLAVHDRLFVSELSAAGTSISLKGNESYFDKYLDEIVYFFESIRVIDLVVFEDLDRFDDPGIFEALRELNTLLNSSKQMRGKTVRFVYALRDSIFEMLGQDATVSEGDVARAAAARANRTKFFDLVVPIVPFITHRTSRDLLTRLLNDRKDGELLPVSQELVDLVARHLPDMRLLTNIRNEYAIFAQRLITERRGVGALGADQLFAMVVYKNIHLSDFEHILLGRSNLDALYKLSREMVTKSIDARRVHLRLLADEAALSGMLTRKAERWGAQLDWFVQAAVSSNPRLPLTGYEVNGAAFGVDQTGTAAFWKAVVSATGLEATRGQPEAPGNPIRIAMDDLRRLMGEAFPGDGWDGIERAELAHGRARLEGEIEILQTAGFKVLAQHDEFVHEGHGDATFTALLERQIDSEVGRALITEGFIDRYYTLYVAQYYGEHVPPNAMNFIVQNVDPNRPDVNYHFSTDDEITALLNETKRSFLSLESAQNIELLDYLLARQDSDASTVLDAATGRTGEAGRAFLNTYFSVGRHATTAAAYLAREWPLVLSELIGKAELTHARRLELVSSALANSNSKVNYQFDDTVKRFLQDNYESLPILARLPAVPTTGSGTAGGPDDPSKDAIGSPDFTAEQTQRAVATLRRAGFVCNDLGALNTKAVEATVKAHCYLISASNLRIALDDPVSLGLDRIRAINKGVYDDCLDQPDEYLAAITSDVEAATLAGAPIAESRTKWTVEDPAEFAAIVGDLARSFDQPPLGLISNAHPDALVDPLSLVPNSAWPALAQTRRFRVTLENVDEYLTSIGDLDSDLAAVLEEAAHIDVEAETPNGAAANEAEDDFNSAMKTSVATAILKAANFLTPAIRVGLVASLELDYWFPVESVQPEVGKLLGLLIAEQICEDEPLLFARFPIDDWETLCFAISQSSKFVEFMTPTLLAGGRTTRLLTSDEVNSHVKEEVLRRFDEFIDITDDDELSAAGYAAIATDTPITIANIVSIATRTGDADLVVQLFSQLGAAPSPDEIIATLGHLGPPYNGLLTSGAKLSFAATAHNESVLKRLHTPGRITMRVLKASRFKKARIEVTVK